MMKHFCHFSLVIFAVCVLAVMPSFAQFDTAEVLGSIRDQSGAVVPQAALTLLNVANGLLTKTTADENGNYTFSNVKIGAYRVTAEATGFSKAATDITLDVGARQRVDLVLQVGGVTETVEVVDAAAVLETDSSERGQVVNSE